MMGTFVGYLEGVLGACWRRTPEASRVADEQDNTERTEDPTQKRLDEALERGDVVKSQEVNTWFVIAGGDAGADHVQQLRNRLRGLDAESLADLAHTRLVRVLGEEVEQIVIDLLFDGAQDVSGIAPPCQVVQPRVRRARTSARSVDPRVAGRV